MRADGFLNDAKKPSPPTNPVTMSTFISPQDFTCSPFVLLP